MLDNRPKLSGVIAALKKELEAHGDVPVTIFTYDGEGETEPVLWSAMVDENDKVLEITFCDQSWVDAFAE